jgi:O-antigen ligase
LLLLGGLVFLPSVLIFMIYTGSFELIFHDFIEFSRGERSLERIGTGRPFVWHHNLTEFSKVTFDRQIAGVGIGNKVGEGGVGDLTHENFWPSHNDFLAVLIYTGIVGFLIFVMLQFAFLKKTLSLPGKEKYVFTALLLSIIAMTFSTGSYVSYYGLAQIYYLVMSYIEMQLRTSTVPHDG